MEGLFLGIDIGTSGARAIAIDEDGAIAGQGAASLADFGANPRQPGVWWAAVCRSLADCLAGVDTRRVRALAVDGTSGTVLPIDAAGMPLAEPLMYNDRVEDAQLLARIQPMIAPESAAHGPTSGLAKMLVFQSILGVARMLHQADWIAGKLSGRFDVTDENNALKSGYDPILGKWPDWIAATGLDTELLPEVGEPGTAIGAVAPEIAKQFGLSAEVLVVAGTTDGCASFLATGASEAGEGVTALGSTLTLKLLSDRPVSSPSNGVYSHRILGNWLAGGASNSGGQVLAHFFGRDRLSALSDEIDPATSSGLDYYPLLAPGERFPVMDPRLEPRLTPRPANDAEFLKAMLEGIAGIEATGYRKLAELGAPALKSVRSVGGGARNRQWTAIRHRHLGVPLIEPASVEAAAGTARLALAGAVRAAAAS